MGQTRWGNHKIQPVFIHYHHLICGKTGCANWTATSTSFMLTCIIQRPYCVVCSYYPLMLFTISFRNLPDTESAIHTLQIPHLKSLHHLCHHFYCLINHQMILKHLPMYCQFLWAQYATPCVYFVQKIGRKSKYLKVDSRKWESAT